MPLGGGPLAIGARGLIPWCGAWTRFVPGRCPRSPQRGSCLRKSRGRRSNRSLASRAISLPIVRSARELDRVLDRRLHAATDSSAATFSSSIDVSPPSPPRHRALRLPTVARPRSLRDRRSDRFVIGRGAVDLVRPAGGDHDLRGHRYFRVRHGPGRRRRRRRPLGFPDDDKIAWYENLGGGSFGVQQVITTSARRATPCTPRTWTETATPTFSRLPGSTTRSPGTRTSAAAPSGCNR